MPATFGVKEHIVPAQHIRGYPHATRHSQEQVLALSVKQYFPITSNQSADAITIIAAHANGFPKELYEPLWEEILERSRAAGFEIRGIWIADMASQGQSGVLNEGKLGNDPSWFDHARDLLHLINMFRHEMPRPLFSIGHSVGASNLVNLGLIHPRLFEGQILIDPVVQASVSARVNFEPAYFSSMRRDLWPSREAARTAFLRSKFYQAWDPRVLDRWIEHGLRELPTEIYPQAHASLATTPEAAKEPKQETPNKITDTTNPVTLTTTKHNEVFHYLRPHFRRHDDEGKAIDNPGERLTHFDFDPHLQPSCSFYRAESVITFHNLPFLRPPVLYIFGETSPVSTSDLKADKLATTGTGVGGSGGAKAGCVSAITVKQAGHLVPMEKVEETADACAHWIGQEMKRWRRDEVWLAQKWRDTPERDKYMLSKEHVERLKVETREQLDQAEPADQAGKSKL